VHWFKALLYCVATVIPLGAAADALRGRVVEMGTRRPLSGVNIFILPQKLKATTDENGNFEFLESPVGEFQWVINFTGYKKLELTGDLAQPTVLYLERLNYNGLETTIVGKAEKRDDTTRTLKAKDFLTMPGAQGDPVKAVQNLPGAARVGGFNSTVIIQGSAPQDTQYLLNDHAVPLVFHFGGLTSVVTPEAIESVDYLSAGYGPEHSRAMGGVINLHMRDPLRDRTHGFGFVDFMKAGGLVEGPINSRSSYLVTGRYSYLGVLLSAAAKGNENFNLTVAPSFADLAGVYKNEVSGKDVVRVTALSSRDEISFLLKKPVNDDPALRGNFSNETLFYRFIPEWTHEHDASAKSRTSLGVGQERVKVDLGENFFIIDQFSVSQRYELEKKYSDSWTAYWGLDNQYQDNRVRLRLPTFYSSGGVNNPISSGGTDEIDVVTRRVQGGAYLRNVIHNPASPWTHSPSVRLDYFSQTREFLPAPRLAERYQIDPSQFLRGATGLYYQPPLPQEISADVGNPHLRSPYAWHGALGFEKDFRGGTDQGFEFAGGLFYRHFENLVVQVPDPTIRYENVGTGQAHGLEVQLKYNLHPWSAWLTYTYSRSTREEPSHNEHLFEHDQTHNFNLMGAVELPSNWKLSTRFRYVTGNPFTPTIGGIFDSDNDVYLPVRGAYFSERKSPFLQLDLRIDKKWIYRTWILSAYLDIQNLTNHQNIESIRYSYDFRERTAVTGIPFLPIFGLRGDF
jgi:hypothetical protein